ncbi:DUF7868 domain-containing protein [Gordonia sp. NPDC003424]
MSEADGWRGATEQAAWSGSPFAPGETTVAGGFVAESPFAETVVGDTFLHTEAQQFDPFAAPMAESETVSGCGGPVSGNPPLIFRGTGVAQSRNPWVGRAQTLLNVFLAQQRSGTADCTDRSAGTNRFITTMRARLAQQGQDPLVVDCKFGPGTETATMMFQACRGLVRDGKIGEKTWPPLSALGTAPSPSPTPTPTPPTPTPTPGVRVREDVWRLSSVTTWHPTLLWYARAVGALKARDVPPFAEPRSWRHLAEAHGTDIASAAWPAGALWDQCEHFTWHFLPWHRAYLHHFERLVRDEIRRLGGPDDWALPFWNYSDDTRPEVRFLPPAFRAQQLPDGTPNPLFDARRARGAGASAGKDFNSGTLGLEDRDVATKAVFDQTSFLPPPGVTTSFGGGRAPVGSHFGAAGAESGALERVPHGNVHTAVGGRGQNPGLMSRFQTAGQDAIFWLHHANIDRVWEAWLRSSAGNANPADTAWLDARWRFGGGAAATTITTRQLLDPRQAPLGYRYSDMPVTPTPEFTPELERIAVAADRMPPPADRPPELVGASQEAVPLTAQPTSTRVALGTPAGPSAALLREGPGVPDGVKVYLRLENITGTMVHASGVVVYVNVPAGGIPSDYPDREAGVVSMFGVVETSRRDDRHSGSGLQATFDISRIARSLATAGQWDPAKLDVTFVPITDSGGGVDRGDVKVGRVSVFYA